MLAVFQLLQQWNSLDDSSRKKYNRKTSPCPEPTLSLFRPDVCFGSVSETFNCITHKYLQGRAWQREDRLDSPRCFLILIFMAPGSALTIGFIICLSKVVFIFIGCTELGAILYHPFTPNNEADICSVTEVSKEQTIVDTFIEATKYIVTVVSCGYNLPEYCPVGS